MDRPDELIIGLMSGTSVDGIDAALVSFESACKLSVVETEFTPFSDDLRAAINSTALNNSMLFRNEDSPLHKELAEHYAQASLSLIKKSALRTGDISAIANHGQTVRHEPNATAPFSLQLGDGQLVADRTRIRTISQFRQADIAAGGQGAPLMTAFHNVLFGRSDDAFVLNLGGIANISRLGAQVVGFDTGPGNCLMDQWIEQHLGQRFDRDAEWASSGTRIESVLSQLMTDPYLHEPHPKSTGTDHYNLHWLNRQIPDLGDYPPEDIQASLLAFTVESIGLALEQLNARTGELYVCGGGAQNPAIMASLKHRLNSFEIDKTDALGVPSDWVESVGFAWLGYCKQHNIPSNLPSVTGADKPVVLGQTFTPSSG